LLGQIKKSIMTSTLKSTIIFFVVSFIGSKIQAQLSCAGRTTVNFSYSASPQTWTVPVGVTSIRIKSRGATGGNATSTALNTGGGAVIEGEYPVSSGTVLTIITGQRGANGDNESGGGGSTGVYIGATLFIVAGGGGGEDNTGAGGNAVVANNGTNGSPLHVATACPGNHINNSRGGVGGNGGNAGEVCLTNINGGGGGGGLNSAGGSNATINGARGGGQGSILGAIGGAAGTGGAAGGRGWSGGGGADDRESGGGGGYSGGGGGGEGGTCGGGGSFLNTTGLNSSFTANGAGTTTLSDGTVQICYVSPPLPLGLISFAAKKKIDANILNWSTEYESDLTDYEIQKSADGRIFLTIGQIQATNRSQKTDYEFIDRSSTTGNKLYRLKINGLNETKYSAIVLIKTLNKEDIFIFPNPAKDVLQLSSTEQIQSIQIINIHGSVLFQKNKLNLTEAITIKDFKPGIYFVKIQKTDGTIQSLKFVKE
jgi:hypothetical protein